MQPVNAPLPTRPASRRRWLVVAIVALLVLGSYAGALAWVTRRLEIDVQKSIHPVPAALSDRASD